MTADQAITTSDDMAGAALTTAKQRLRLLMKDRLSTLSTDNINRQSKAADFPCESDMRRDRR
jgi:hypothetical protein